MSNTSDSEKEVAVEGRRSHGNPAYRTIWEVIDEIMVDVPEAALNRLPEDGAERHDRYLNGAHEKASQKS